MVSILTLHFKGFSYYAVCTKLTGKFAWEQKFDKTLSEIYFSITISAKLCAARSEDRF